MNKFSLRVPASTSNLGSGFDTISAALRLYLRIEVELADDSEIEWLTPWPATEENLVDRSLRDALRYIGRSPPGIRLRMDNPIPLKRGLGSSGAAVAAGIRLAEHLTQVDLATDEVMRLGYPLEGHPDNLAASLLGGWVLSRVEGGEIRCERIESTLRCRFVVAVPEVTVSTSRAREILPSAYTLHDVVFNLQRCALLVHALHANRPELVQEALQDRLHQPYRQTLVPGLSALLEKRSRPRRLEDHLLGVAISGSGSAAAALANGSYEAIGEWMLAVLDEAGTAAQIMLLDLDSEGPRIESD